MIVIRIIYLGDLSKSKEQDVAVIVGDKKYIKNLHLYLKESKNVEGYFLNNLKQINFSDKLSMREQEIMSLVSQGLSNKEISELMEISIHTVKNHLYNSYKKLGVSDRLKASVKMNRTK